MSTKATSVADVNVTVKVSGEEQLLPYVNALNNLLRGAAIGVGNVIDVTMQLMKEMERFVELKGQGDKKRTVVLSVLRQQITNSCNTTEEERQLLLRMLETGITSSIISGLVAAPTMGLNAAVQCCKLFGCC